MIAPASAGSAAGEPTPERTAFVRFRAELVCLCLDRVLFETITRQLDARGVMIWAGNLWHHRLRSGFKSVET